MGCLRANNVTHQYFCGIDQIVEVWSDHIYTSLQGADKCCHELSCGMSARNNLIQTMS